MPRNQSIHAKDVDILLSTHIVRPPLSSELESLQPASQIIPRLNCPLFSCRISAGFPSPASDYVEKNLDLNDLMVLHPAATFFVRVSGDSMRDAGILEGDYLVIDRSLKVAQNDIVIAVVDGELTVKRFFRNGSMIELRPENVAYPAIQMQAGMELLIWGVVTGVVRKTR
jgi:DNA polymerase V